jgi:hypothetical protein
LPTQESHLAILNRPSCSTTTRLDFSVSCELAACLRLKLESSSCEDGSWEAVLRWLLAQAGFGPDLITAVYAALVSADVLKTKKPGLIQAAQANLELSLHAADHTRSGDLRHLLARHHAASAKQDDLVKALDEAHDLFTGALLLLLLALSLHT